MKKRILSFIFIGIFTVGLTACNNGTPTPSPIPDNGPKRGGEVSVGITSDIDGFDPHKITSAGTREIQFNVYEGLVKGDSKGNLNPAVAESYTISADATEYNFVLREGVKFSNGKPVTGADVVYSLRRLAGTLENQDPEVAKVAAMSIIDSISSTEKDGKTVITIKLSQPNTELLCYLTGAIVPENYQTSDGPAPGVGPFKFGSYTPLQEYVIVRNENYYNPEIPYLDKVVFKIMTDSDAAFMQVLAGSIDIYPYLTADQELRLPAGYHSEVGGVALVQALFLNADVVPFNDIRIRKALNYAIDRRYIIDMVGGGKGTPVCSGIFPGFTKYYDASLETAYTKDLDKAKELLKEAGYPDGFNFTLTVPSNYKFHIDTAQVVAEQLKEIGVNVRVESIEWASWHSDVYKGEKYQGTIIGLDSNLAPGDILRFYPSTSSKNFMNYNNPEFDRIYAEAAAEADDAKKIADYKLLQKMLCDDAAAVFIQNPALMVAVKDTLSGYTFYPLFVQEMSTIYYK